MTTAIARTGGKAAIQDQEGCKAMISHALAAIGMAGVLLSGLVGATQLEILRQGRWCSSTAA